LVRAVQVNQFLKTCQLIDPDQVISGENRNEIPGASDTPLKQRLRLLTSTRLMTPFCSQFHHPYIVLPEYLLGFDQQKLNFIIRHELEHLKTGHPLQLFLQRLVEVVFWFHPMVWWASQQSALSREFACDDAAIESPAEIAMYLRTLLTIIEYGASQADETHTPLAFSRGKSLTAKRARRLTQIAKNNSKAGRASVSGVTASCSLFIAAIFIGCVWVPVDVLASPRASWSPWPTWTAGALHDFGFSVHDFDAYNGRIELHELLEHTEAAEMNHSAQHDRRM
ncbi:MAG: M56 family metallopeptidase, partial [Planctomycetaceae bacterium]|nr:M56 family metallopeptidase [Planctomycetaceae bacterium]